MNPQIIDIANNLSFNISSILGILAFAISGFLVGVRHRLDIMGLVIVAALPAVGGGIIRDLLINQVPHSLLHPKAFLLVIIAVLVAFIFRLHKIDNVENKFLFVISDSLGLVAFSITGALTGIQAGLSIFGVIILSFITAVGGGIIRDVLVNDDTIILQKGFYGSVAILTASALYFIDYLGYNGGVSTLIVFLCGIVLRLVAYFRRWNLPIIKY